jgi:hypothetical protein
MKIKTIINFSDKELKLLNDTLKLLEEFTYQLPEGMEQDSLVAEEGIECIQHIIGLVTNDELVKEEGEL